MKTTTRLLAIVAVLASMAVVPAHATHCSSGIYVFNYIHRTSVALDANATGCDIDPDDEIDLRVIYPGAVAITVRYSHDLGVGTPTLTATLDGIGYSGTQVTLNRIDNDSTGTAPFFVYDSEQLTLPQGRISSGTLTVTLALPGGATDTTCYHTVDTAC